MHCYLIEVTRHYSDGSLTRRYIPCETDYMMDAIETASQLTYSGEWDVVQVFNRSGMLVYDYTR